MPRLKDVSNGLISAGTSTFDLSTDGRTLGGVMLNTDGTNLATLVLKKTNISGTDILSIKSTNSIFIGGPFDAADTIYYELSGSGSPTFQAFEWTPYRGAND